MVWEVYNAVKVPVVGMGGIYDSIYAIEMMMAGASAVQVGAAIFTDPVTPVYIVERVNQWLDDHGIHNVSELVGTVKPWYLEITGQGSRFPDNRRFACDGLPPEKDLID